MPLVRPWDEETATTVEGAGLEREGAAVLVPPPPPREIEGAEVTVAEPSSIRTSIYEATNTSPPGASTPTPYGIVPTPAGVRANDR